MIRVLIVDDSALFRVMLKDILGSAVGIEVVGVAADAFAARDKFKKLKPDVLTLDIEMPGMNGLEFLEKLMNYQPTPVIMVSSLTTQGAEATLKALSLGAIDFVAKPAGQLEVELPRMSEEIVEKIRAAHRARVKNVRPSAAVAPVENFGIDEVLPRAQKPRTVSGPPVICVGASTGGTTAIEFLLTHLQSESPGLVIVQHMPAGYTLAFAERVNALSPLEVLEAKDGLEVIPGRAIIAAGGYHTLLQRGAGGYFVQVKDGVPVNRHKPSVDVLFRSAANTAGANALGILLTGMGDDGARGLLDLRNTGAHTLAQDEDSCVIFGMPKVAIELGAAARIVALGNIPYLIKTYAERTLTPRV